MAEQYNIRLEEDSQQIIGNYTEDFPIAVSFTDFDNIIRRQVPWHWHPAFEIDYIVDGSGAYVTGSRRFVLNRGEAVFFNSNVLHATGAADRVHGHKEYCIKFEMSLLSGMYNSIFEQKYVLPVLQAKSLDAFLIKPDHPLGVSMISHILRVIDLFREKNYGYEFEIRHELSLFWMDLLSETAKARSESVVAGSADSARMKPMLSFIHDHYGEKIDLSAIAEAGSISKREATRCFNRSIGLSPFEYLNLYRIRMAARKLLITDESVAQISEDCGFSSPGYFGKVFSKEMKMTPLQYRKAHTQ